jgi:hypothetical protein
MPFAVPTGGRLLRLIRPSSLSARTFSASKCRLEQIHGADEAVCHVYFIRCAYCTFDVVDASPQTLGRVTAATKTNERVALVDFYAECVWQLRCDHRRTNDVIDVSCTGGAALVKHSLQSSISSRVIQTSRRAQADQLISSQSIRMSMAHSRKSMVCVLLARRPTDLCG